jgi:hypothetical protein
MAFFLFLISVKKFISMVIFDIFPLFSSWRWQQRLRTSWHVTSLLLLYRLLRFRNLYQSDNPRKCLLPLELYDDEDHEIDRGDSIDRWFNLIRLTDLISCCRRVVLLSKVANLGVQLREIARLRSLSLILWAN